jgi:hypothetical protein
MTAGDWAAWVQAIGSIAGIGIAIGVPFALYSREQKERRLERGSYRMLLLEAFSELYRPIAYLAGLKTVVDGLPPGTARVPPEENAKHLAGAVVSMRDALNVVNEIEDVNKLDRFEAVLGILALRRMLKEAMPTFEKEHRWLEGHPESDAVVGSAFNTLTYHAIELEPAIARVIKALDMKER